jgi:hypothetical protein
VKAGFVRDAAFKILIFFVAAECVLWIMCAYLFVESIVYDRPDSLYTSISLFFLSIIVAGGAATFFQITPLRRKKRVLIVELADV